MSAGTPLAILPIAHVTVVPVAERERRVGKARRLEPSARPVAGARTGEFLMTADEFANAMGDARLTSTADRSVMVAR